MIKSQRLRIFFERNGFAVSTRLAELLGMKVKSVRLFFVYASFTTLIGGFVLYLTLAFWLKLKDLIYTKRTSVLIYNDVVLQNPLFRALLLLVLILLFGITGFYITTPDFSFFDALYMTVITLSTVGYTEVEGFSDQGRSFAVAFILVAFVVVAIAIRFIVESLFSQWNLNYWKQKKIRS